MTSCEFSIPFTVNGISMICDKKRFMKIGTFVEPGILKNGLDPKLRGVKFSNSIELRRLKISTIIELLQAEVCPFAKLSVWKIDWLYEDGILEIRSSINTRIRYSYHRCYLLSILIFCPFNVLNWQVQLTNIKVSFDDEIIILYCFLVLDFF